MLVTRWSFKKVVAKRTPAPLLSLEEEEGAVPVTARIGL